MIKLDEEVLIRLPVLIILNANLNSFAVFSFELNYFIKWNVILASNCITVDCFNKDISSSSFFVKDLDFKLLLCLTD
jgi:hypothetical protein